MWGGWQALIARRHGATLVTCNREDFALLSEATGVMVLYPVGQWTHSWRVVP